MLSTLAPILFPSRAPPLFQGLKLWTRDITEQSKQYVKVFYHTAGKQLSFIVIKTE